MEFNHASAKLAALDMHYVTAGQGSPLVLLHGWPQSWYEWRHIMDALQRDFFLIAPDLRGLGDSYAPRNFLRKYSREWWAKAHPTDNSE